MLGRSIVSLFATTALLLVTGAAGAANYSMTGQWWMNRGPLVDIPQNGGPAICFDSLTNGCVHNLKPVNGGIPAKTGTTVTVNPTSLGTISVKTNAFSEPYRASASTNAVTFAVTVVQLSSNFAAAAPQTKGVLKQGRWATDPKQGGRLAADFAWCPGGPMGNPGCAAPASGTLPHLVKYTTNAAQFGGTMNVLLQGQGSIAVKKDAVTNGKIQIQPIGAGMTPGPQAPGRGYATTDTDMLFGGSTFSTYQTGVPCTGPFGGGPKPAGCGVITHLGNKTATGVNDTATNWAFPWTTGMVTAINHGTIGGVPQSTTLIGTGTQNRNAIGAGNITLVAGGASHRAVANQDFSALDVVTMKLVAPVPALSTPGLAAGVVLLALCAGYALRKHF